MNDDFITQLYRNFLGREPDAAGLAYWNSQLQSGTLDAISLTKTLLQSVEHQTIFKPIALMYYAALDRMPDEAGLVYWANEMRNGASIGMIAASIAASDEFAALHGKSSNEQFLIDLYDSALERAPDTAGLNFWKSVLEIGFDRAIVMQSIATSPEMIKTRSEEVDFVLMYRGIFGVLPTQELVDATLPFRDLLRCSPTLVEPVNRVILASAVLRTFSITGPSECIRSRSSFGKPQWCSMRIHYSTAMLVRVSGLTRGLLPM